VLARALDTVNGRELPSVVDDALLIV
jgi:hypothetical protein